MAVTVAVPAKAMRGRHSFGDDHLGADRETPERGPAQNQIAEMAVLLSNTRGSVILGGGVLSALTIGIALEAAFSPSVLRPGLVGVVTASLLGCVIVCWLRAAGLDRAVDGVRRQGSGRRAAASGQPAGSRPAQRPSLADRRPARSPGAVAEHAVRRGQRGGLVMGAGGHDARRGPGPAGADPVGGNLDFHYRRVLPALDRGGPSGGVRRRAGPASRPLMAGPACLPRPRLPRALPGPPSSVPPMAQRAGKTRVLPRSLSTVAEWLIVEPVSALSTRWHVRQSFGDMNQHGMVSTQRFWGLLDDAEQELLRALSLMKVFPPGTTICVEGDPATHVFVLIAGLVKILSVTEDGHEIVLALRGNGDIVGELAGESIKL